MRIDSDLRSKVFSHEGCDWLFKFKSAPQELPCDLMRELPQRHGIRWQTRVFLLSHHRHTHNNT
jgi:hypothetical protein